MQRGQLPEVAGHGAPPEADINPAAAGGGLLAAQRACGGRGRQAIERHVDQRGDPALGGGPGRAREAFPLGAARLVDVDVGIDHAGQQHLLSGEFLDADGAGGVAERGERGDPAVPDGHRGRPDAVGGDHAPSTDHELIVGHAISPSAPWRATRAPGPGGDVTASSQSDAQQAVNMALRWRHG
jgi:hypothetical protein